MQRLRHDYITVFDLFRHVIGGVFFLSVEPNPDNTRLILCQLARGLPIQQSLNLGPVFSVWIPSRRASLCGCAAHGCDPCTSAFRLRRNNPRRLEDRRGPFRLFPDQKTRIAAEFVGVVAVDSIKCFNAVPEHVHQCRDHFRGLPDFTLGFVGQSALPKLFLKFVNAFLRDRRWMHRGLVIAVSFCGWLMRGDGAGRRSRTVTEGKRATRIPGAGSPLTGRRALPNSALELSSHEKTGKRRNRWSLAGGPGTCGE